MGRENHKPDSLNYATPELFPRVPLYFPPYKLMRKDLKKMILIFSALSVLFFAASIFFASSFSAGMMTNPQDVTQCIIKKGWAKGLLLFFCLASCGCLAPFFLFLKTRNKLSLAVILLILPIIPAIFTLDSCRESSSYVANSGRTYYCISVGDPSVGDPDAGYAYLATDKIDNGYAWSYRVVGSEFSGPMSFADAPNIPKNTPDGTILEGSMGDLYIIYSGFYLLEYFER